MKRILCMTLLLLLLVTPLASCKTASELQDGYYTAQASEFSHGWKEYITILVKGGSIVSVEYNAENASGFIKSWDNTYMQTMLHANGTYPNEYTRLYGTRLLETQDIEAVDAVTGATHSGTNFYKLVSAAVEQAQKGDSEVAIVGGE